MSSVASNSTTREVLDRLIMMDEPVGSMFHAAREAFIAFDREGNGRHHGGNMDYLRGAWHQGRAFSSHRRSDQGSLAGGRSACFRSGTARTLHAQVEQSLSARTARKARMRAFLFIYFKFATTLGKGYYRILLRL